MNSRECVESNELFDFLRDIVAHVPVATAAKRPRASTAAAAPAMKHEEPSTAAEQDDDKSASSGVETPAKKHKARA